MASIAGSMLVALGVDPKGLTQGLQNAEKNINSSAKAMEKSVGDFSDRSARSLLSFARSFALTITGLLSVTSMFKSYFGGVAEVARMTGAYSTKLEEWRKKRALLQRVTREDVELYKKNREALTRFQISVADLSTKLMREASPAIKFFTDGLNKLSEWVDNNQNNIIRFVKVLATTITVALIPAFIKLTATMLKSPITWIMLLIGALALAIDDLIVWIKGGDSALGEFWGTLGSKQDYLDFFRDALKFCIDNLGKLTIALIVLSVPALRAFAWFITKNVIKALWGLATTIIKTVIPKLATLAWSLISLCGKALLQFTGLILTRAIPAVGAFATALLTCPITWIIAGIAGIIYILKDLWDWLKGGESTFGKYFDILKKGWEDTCKFYSEWWEDICNGIVKKWKWVTNEVADFFDWVTGGDIKASIENVTKSSFNSKEEAQKFLDFQNKLQSGVDNLIKFSAQAQNKQATNSVKTTNNSSVVNNDSHANVTIINQTAEAGQASTETAMGYANSANVTGQL